MSKDKADNFIEELNEAGAQAKAEYQTQYNLLSEEVKAMVDEGHLPKKTLKALKAIEANKPVKEKKPRASKKAKAVIEKPAQEVVYNESDEPFEFTSGKIYVREFLPAIISGIPSLAKGIVAKHFVWSEIDSKKIGIDKAMDDKKGAMCISNVYYTTPNGNRFRINLQDIYNILLKIDFE